MLYMCVYYMTSTLLVEKHNRYIIYNIYKCINIHVYNTYQQPTDRRQLPTENAAH